MKKTILSLAVLIATSVSFSAFAQKPADTKCSTDSCCATVCESVLFEGITLTPDQQTKIKALKENAAKAKADKAKADRTAKTEGRKSARKDYLNNMKSVLTPDQYVIFLENAYVNVPDGKGFKKGDARRDMKKGEVKKGELKGKPVNGAKDGKHAKDAKKPEKK